MPKTVVRRTRTIRRFCRCTLICARAGRLHHLSPLGDFTTEVRAKLLRRSTDRLEAGGVHPLLDVSPAEHLDRLGLQPRDHLVRRAGGNEQAIPVAGFISGYA